MSNTIDNISKKSWEYCTGYNDGFKEGYTKALEIVVEQEKYKPTHQILISPNGIIQKVVTGIKKPVISRF